MKRTKMLCFALCLALLFPAIAGCKTTGDPKDESTPQQSTATTTPATETQTTTAPVDLNGYTFRLAGSHMGKFTPVPGMNILNDEWQEKLDDMQEAHGFKLEMISMDNTLESVVSYVMAGDDVADFFFQRHSDMFVNAAHGFIRQLDGEELIAAGMNVWDESKWDPVYTGLPKFNDHIWAVSTNGIYYLASFGDVLCFNPELTSHAGYDAAAMYDLVRNKEWTWDKYLEIARKAARDLDGDGVNDVWGTGMGIFQFGEKLITNDFSPIYQDSTGKWVADFTNPKYINALDFIAKATDPDIRDSALGNSGGPFKESFAAGKTALNQFYGWNFWDDSDLEHADFAFGVIPTPLGADADNYISCLPEIDAWTMLVTTKEVEKAVACMNLWGDIMTDNEWQERTKNECFRDEASWEMFETYIYPNTRLNYQQTTQETWEYIRENIVKGIMVERKTPSQVTESVNAVIQEMLDRAFN